MGKFEKLIVLTVLFAAAVVLAISFNRGSDETKAASPLVGADELLEESTPLPGLQQPTAPPQNTPGATPDSEPSSLMLNAGSEVAPAGLQAAPSSTLDREFAPERLSVEPRMDPMQPILADSTGLRPSFLSDYMQYTVVAGDTWSSLAQRFYQDGRFTRNLHLANEDLSDLTPGKEILVPVYDFLVADGESVGASEPSVLETAQPEPAGAAFLTHPGTPAVKPVDLGTTPSKGLVYEVRSGDTLSEISLAVFGTSTRWKELLDANQDVLTKPEALRVGMKLKIPAGGKLPSAAAAKPQTPKSASKDTAGKSQTAAVQKPEAQKKRKVL